MYTYYRKMRYLTKTNLVTLHHKKINSPPQQKTNAQNQSKKSTRTSLSKRHIALNHQERNRKVETKTTLKEYETHKGGEVFALTSGISTPIFYGQSGTNTAAKHKQPRNGRFIASPRPISGPRRGSGVK